VADGGGVDARLLVVPVARVGELLRGEGGGEGDARPVRGPDRAPGAGGDVGEGPRLAPLGQREDPDLAASVAGGGEGERAAVGGEGRAPFVGVLRPGEAARAGPVRADDP